MADGYKDLYVGTSCRIEALSPSRGGDAEEKEHYGQHVRGRYS